MAAPDRFSRRRFLAAGSALVAAGLVVRPGQPGWARQRSTADDDKLIVRTADPFNAEPALAVLVANYITPVEHFYVRNHGPTPRIEAGDFQVQVEGLVNQPLDLSVAELQERFAKQSVEATLTCAGNRRQEMSAMKPISGVQWDAGAIGHAKWTGVTLAEVLKASEIKEGAKHVWFEGADPIKEKDGSVAPFGGSIPLEKALAEDAPALLAFAMNDAPLTAEHGFPLRTVVPGYIGARSVKWLKRIVVSDRPSPNHYVAEAYKIIRSTDPAEVAAAEPIYAFPVNGAICTPAAGSSLKAGRNKVSGYALPAGEPGTFVENVDISADGGQTLTRARFLDEPRPYAWRRWTAELELPAGKRSLLVRAIDSGGHTQPKTFEWNAKGYLYNAWHSVSVDVS